MSFVCFNGTLVPAEQPLLTGSNRCFKWGDGLFETMKFSGGRLSLEHLHWERLRAGMELLEMDADSLRVDQLKENMLTLCRKNGLDMARVRLQVYRKDKNHAGHVMEALPLDASVNEWQEPGMRLGLYTAARKSQDAFSNMKTANFLPYVMASRFAGRQHWDDALLLNASGHICDTTRANIFLFIEGRIHTPALAEGCVGGVMRRFLLEKFRAAGMDPVEGSLSIRQLEEAEEVFLSNSIFGIRSVRSFNGRSYPNDRAIKIYRDFIATM